MFTHADHIQKMNSDPVFRLDYIKRVLHTRKDPANIQNIYTPPEIIHKMLQKTDLNNKTILVMFNLEILEILISSYKINRENIYFMADSKYDLKFAKCYKNINIIDKLYSKESLLELGLFMNFDLVISNPPYNSGLDLKILNIVLSFTKEAIIVHPTTWLYDMKNIHKLFVDFKNNFGNRIKSLEIFNGNEIFNVYLHCPCVISCFSENSEYIQIIDNINETEYRVDNIYDVTKFGKDWEIIKPFFLQIKEYCKNNNNLNEKTCIKLNQNYKDISKFYVQFALIRGHDNDTLLPKDINITKFIRGNNTALIYQFNTELEQNDFLNYCCTDFARFCLSLYKNNGNLNSGELAIVPWMDFTQEWTDEKLYEYFNVSEEIKVLIKKYIKPYYE